MRSIATFGTLGAVPRVTKRLRRRFDAALKKDAKLRARWEGKPPGGHDQSRSAWDLSLARLMRPHGFTLEEFAALAAKWEHGKGADGDARHFGRCWERAGENDAFNHDRLALDLADDWQDKARYVAAWGRWLEWLDVCWQRDEVLSHMSAARRWLRDLANSLE